MATQQVGRRKLYGANLADTRLVVGTISGEDLTALKGLMVKYGHRAAAGVVRLALRRLHSARSSDKVAVKIASAVKRESCSETPEHKQFNREKVSLPVHLEADDNEILEDVRNRYDLSSFAQVVRMSIRYASAKE